MKNALASFMSPQQQKTWKLRALSLFKVPLLAACSPSVIDISESRSVVKIPNGLFTKNHVGSMYFGALCMGAELSVAYPVVIEVFEKRKPLNFLFTNFQCQFSKKAKEDMYFVFNEVEKLQTAMDKVINDGGSAKDTYNGAAYLKSQWQSETEPVMNYSVEISLKNTKS